MKQCYGQCGEAFSYREGRGEKSWRSMQRPGPRLYAISQWASNFNREKKIVLKQLFPRVSIQIENTE
jgi:hypothetical protein